MKYNSSQLPTAIVFISLIFAATLIHFKPTSNQQSSIDLKTLSTQTIIPNRLSHFIQLLNNQGAHIKNQQDFQIKTQDRNYRFQLAHQTNIDTNLILLHHELATLQNSNINELDAQLLHFAHRNYQNPFTGQTINPKFLVTTNPESILMDIQGFQAGNPDPLAQSYQINLSTIESWIQTTKQQLQSEKYASSN